MQKHLLHHKPNPKVSKKLLLASDIIGWIGAFMLVLAYLLISFGVLGSETVWYQILNILGAGGLLFLGIVRHAIPSAFTNIVWVVIGIVAIINILR
ncbi:MAG: hypothetical protein LBL08_01355 [Candidatus Nomurabacteria bacterium]|jgi:hypothetical protein|nr:hypothetical protein [Candidatus Nomurabacteria bacterium]